MSIRLPNIFHHILCVIGIYIDLSCCRDIIYVYLKILDYSFVFWWPDFWILESTPIFVSILFWRLPINWKIKPLLCSVKKIIGWRFPYCLYRFRINCKLITLNHNQDHWPSVSLRQHHWSIYLLQGTIFYLLINSQWSYILSIFSCSY